MTFKEDIAKVIKEKRSNITDSSIKTYVSLLSSLDKKLNGGEDIKFFSEDKKEILEFNEESSIKKI